mgnify:CR=1 FL=1
MPPVCDSAAVAAVLCMSVTTRRTGVGLLAATPFHSPLQTGEAGVEVAGGVGRGMRDWGTDPQVEQQQGYGYGSVGSRGAVPPTIAMADQENVGVTLVPSGGEGQWLVGDEDSSVEVRLLQCDDAVEELGFGWFHWKLMLLTGSCWTVDAMVRVSWGGANV